MTVNEICKIIGEDLAAARKVRRMRLEDAAARIGTTRQTLAKLEAGEGGVSLGLLVRVATAYGLENQFLKLFEPASDPEAVRLQREQLPRRVRVDGNDLGSLDF